MTDERPTLTPQVQLDVAMRRHTIAHLRRQAYLLEATNWRRIADSSDCSMVTGRANERACLDAAQAQLAIMDAQTAMIDRVAPNHRAPRAQTGD